jgi:cell division protein FtsB
MVERGRSRQTPVLLVCMLLSGYFGYHLLKGEHGIEAQARLKVKAGQLEQQRARLEAMRTRLAHAVALLEGPAIDRDMLDEQARLQLDFTRPGEIVVIDR